MISSRSPLGGQVRRGLQEELRRLTGASAVRVIEGANSVVDEHTHDWPILSLYVMGDVIKVQDGGEVRVNSPTAVLHHAGEPHSNVVRAAGLEQIDIQFDPSWLRSWPGPATQRGIRIWKGGRVAAEANKLRSKWLDPRTPESELARASRHFFQMCSQFVAAREPPWLRQVLGRLECEEPWSTERLARHVDMHPGWLAQSYRSIMGEGIRQTAQRRRIERAVELLRTTDLEAADIAALVGFCDQSHMIRSFKRLLGRGPSQVRREREELQGRTASVQADLSPV